MITVNGTPSLFSGQDKVTVYNGKFTSASLGPYGGLDAGTYTVEVILPLAKVQPDSVKKIIGQNGENSTGNQLVNVVGNVLVKTITSFSISIPTPTRIPTSTPNPTSTPSPQLWPGPARQYVPFEHPDFQSDYVVFRDDESTTNTSDYAQVEFALSNIYSGLAHPMSYAFQITVADTVENAKLEYDNFYIIY